MKAYPAITELVPHQVPMLELDALLDWSPGHAIARLTVRGDSLFARDGAIDTVVSLEYMAQTIAACLGMEAYHEGVGVRVGMIIACRQMKIARPTVRVGEVLTIEATRLNGTDSSSRFDAKVLDEAAEVVATATLTLVHGDAPPDAKPPANCT